MFGQSLRLQKLFNKNENAVIIAVDHGMFDGPIPGMIDIRATVQKINPVVDAVLLSPGTLKQCGDLFAVKGAPLPVIRVNWSTVYCFHWNYQQAITVPACSVADAVSMGAEMVLISLTLKTGNEAVDAENVQVFGKLAAEARQLGIPVIGEFFPANTNTLTADELHEQVLIGTRIIAELGADVIKTFYTRDFKKVTEGCPVPILGLGAEKKPTQREALQLASDEIAEGARGVVFGRNALQVSRPQDFQAALCEVVKKGVTADIASTKYNLKD
jgi:DhnA family fructose-bisphosphate aldolase class Ia